jgi:beta-glucanase (GH16 family)
MKNFAFVIVFVLWALNGSLAQPVLPLDFESTTISYTFTNFGGGAVTKIANPQINGINTSATVAKMIKSAGEVFGGSYITLASPVNFATNKIVKVKVFSPVAGKKLLLKFEGAGATFEKESVGITTANVWQELTFDFTGVAGVNNLNNKIVFIFDLGTQGNGSASSTYLFDDVVQTSNFVGGVTGDYTLVWSDEFAGTGPPADDHWFRQTQIPTPTGWFGDEKQHYTNRDVNSFIANGNLNIVAKKESFTDQGLTKQYTSARLNSKYAFKYGRVDVRAKIGGGAGTLPAIWMLGKNIDEPGGYFAGEFGTTIWPATGEIDIMEHWGNNPNVIHQSIHTPSSFGATVNTNTTTISQVSTTFHIYSLIWDANQIQFLIDDVAYYTYNPTVKNASTWPFDEPLYLLLNIALGGGGDPIDPAFTQSTLEVDFVRVYQKGGTPAPLPAEPTAAAPTPTRPSGNVISLFSNAYTNVSVNSWRTDWSVARLTETQLVGNDVKKYNRLNNVGIEATGANVINASSMLYFHLDAWTPNMTTFRIKLVDFGANNAFGGGDDKEHELSFTPTLNGWNSYEIPLTDFTALTTKSHIAQLILSGIPAGTSTVFIDNVYFHNVDDAPPIVTGDLSHYGNSVSAYPNPSESFLELVGIKGELFNVKLVDLTGRLNYIEFEKHGDVYQASIQHLSPGVYLLEAQEERVLYRFKVIKK